MYTISINDELQEFKNELKTLGITIIKFEKIGNGNMAAFQCDYKDMLDDTVKRAFFWRHDLDNTLEKFRKKYAK